MKVISYNIHKGFNLLGTKYTFESLKAFLIQSDADIVFLQECAGELRPNLKKRIRNRNQVPFEEQLESMADSIWTDYAYGKNAIYDDGHHGNAILSKYPIDEWRNTDLSLSSFEKRGLLYAKIHLQNQPIHLFCTHLNLGTRDRRTQWSTIQSALSNLPEQESVILAGDFNDWAKGLESDVRKSTNLKSPFSRPPKTFPSFFPLLSLDRIYYRGLDIERAWVEKMKNELHSDHLPVFAQFRKIGE